MKEEILDQLKEVYDPEIPINLVDLGLIYSIEINGDEDHADIKMGLTTMGCPAADQLQAQVHNAASSVNGIETADVEIVHDPPWTPAMVTNEGEQALQSMGVI